MQSAKQTAAPKWACSLPFAIMEVADVTTTPAAPISAPARTTQVTSQSVAQQQQAASVRRGKRARQLARGVDNPYITAEPAWSASSSVVQEAECNPTHGPSRYNPEPKRRRLSQAERLAQEASNFRPRNSTRRSSYVPPTDAGCVAFLATVEDPKCKSSLESAVAHWSLLRTDPETGVMEDFLPTWTPMLLKASKNKNDPNLPSCLDAMTGPHREHFIVACKKETDAMENRWTWCAVLRKDVPKDIKIILLKNKLLGRLALSKC